MQSLYIDQFYMDRKINQVIHNLNDFAEEYKEKDWQIQELTKQINKFIRVNNAHLTVNGFNYGYADASNISALLVDYMLTIDLDGNGYYDVYLDEKALDQAFNGELPYKNQEISIQGILYHNQQTVNAQSINNVTIENPSSIIVENAEQVEGKDTAKKTSYAGTAVIADVSKISENITINMNSLLYTERYIQDIMGYYETQYTSKNNVYYTITDMPYVAIKAVHLVKLISMEDGKKNVIEVNASLQPVNEAISALRDYAPFFYLMAMLISIAIALVYSRMVSRPLVTLTHIADKMANMDFTIKSPLKGEDELGVLSNSLNILSCNLDNALSELKEANKQLVLDMEKEKKQEQVRKEFVANVSHELKTPLGIIKGFAEGIKDGIKKEKSNYYMDVILDEIEKMNALILNMLELSKIEAGQDTLQEVFNVKKLIEKTVKLLEMPIQKKQLKISIEGDYTAVQGVKFQIDQVIVNLLSNAVKHGREGTEIIVTGDIRDGNHYISIYNEGNQLTEEELESIWLRFYKLDKSHHRESGGTGLGLAIVKAILEGHDSDYGVMNDKNGITFYFALKADEDGRV